MKQSELNSILKKARLPERSEEFWETFPYRIKSRLKQPPKQIADRNRSGFPRLAWGLATAICILVAFVIGHWSGRLETKTAASQDVLQNARFIHETLAMFPNQVRAIVRDRHGLNLVLSQNDDVPVSPPIYIRICDGTNCSSCVTFSGQEIQIGGQKLTVLSNARGGIILTGNKFVWSSDERTFVRTHLKIEAKNLDVAAT
jgi:hypothetical protein